MVSLRVRVSPSRSQFVRQGFGWELTYVDLLWLKSYIKSFGHGPMHQPFKRSRSFSAPSFAHQVLNLQWIITPATPYPLKSPDPLSTNVTEAPPAQRRVFRDLCPRRVLRGKPTTSGHSSCSISMSTFWPLNSFFDRPPADTKVAGITYLYNLDR